MARTARIEVGEDDYYQHDPPPTEPRAQRLMKDEGMPFDQSLLQGLNDSVIPVPLDEKTMILVSRHYDGDDSIDAYWRTDSRSGRIVPRLYKTCAMYERLRDGHPRIVPFIARDQWTGFPILERPSGPPLEQFLRRNGAVLYPADRGAEYARLEPAMVPLVLKWALDALSALKFLHSKNIAFGRYIRHECWLSADLSLSLVGFYYARYVGPFESQPGDLGLQSDLFEWAGLVHHLLSKSWDWPEACSKDISDEDRNRVLPDSFVVREVLLKCWAGSYASAQETWGVI